MNNDSHAPSAPKVGRGVFKKIVSMKLHWQILIALFFGVILGFITGTEVVIGGNLTFYAVFDFFGTLFIRGLKMVIVPLIVTSIISGVAGVGSSGALGRLGVKTFVYYITTSLAAILIGLVLVNTIQPGIQDGIPVKDLLGLTADTTHLQEKVGSKSSQDLVGIFVRMIPTNPIAAAAEGDMLSIIFFCILVGVFITRFKQARERHLLITIVESLFQVMMAVTHFIIRFAPIGVFGLVARTVASTGFQSFKPLAWYFLTVFLALAIHALITLPALLHLLARVNPVKHIRAMSTALLTAFSTSSSSATLPLTMECVEENAGVSNRVTSFVLPLGATVNMDGTALYECVAAMFIAQAYGLQLGAGAQVLVVVTALLASIGAAGIPSAGLVMISIILNAIGLPLEGVGLILAVDRILDMCRTAVNVFSDSCGAVVIARSEGETDLFHGSMID